jgi:hypothetical protein
MLHQKSPPFVPASTSGIVHLFRESELVERDVYSVTGVPEVCITSEVNFPSKGAAIITIQLNSIIYLFTC